MKKIVLASLFCMLSLSAFCQLPGTTGDDPIEWQVGINHNPITGGGVIRKAPPKLPTLPEAILSGNVLSFVDSHAEYTLYIIDEDGEEVYEVFIPENTSTIALPLYLSGEYELQLVRGNWYFYTYIEL